MLRIAEAREVRGWTQAKLAESLGTTQQTVQRWESGQTDPKISQIKKISETLGITLSFILGMDGYEQLDDTEQEMVGIIRSLSPEGKKQLMVYARGCASTYPKNNEAVGA